MSARRNASSLLRAAAAVVTAHALAHARGLGAQERLIGSRSAAGGITYETWSFAGGALQTGVSAYDTVRVRRVSQWNVPVDASVHLGAGWSADVGATYATGEVALAGSGVGGGTAPSYYRLAGLSDVKLRATGHIFGDAMLLTLGVNAPTGRASLDASQVGALRVLAAPALGLQAPALGTGAAGTAGVVLARRVGAWGVAGGASYEYRAKYQPVAAVAAGAPSVDFAPGDAIHLSLGADGILGQQRTALALTADLFTADELRLGTGTLGTTRVQLGPVLTAEWQLRLAAPRFRELTLAAAERYRAPYRQRGAAVAGSSGNYVEGSLRGVVAGPARGGVVVGLDGRYHTGLSVDSSFATARARVGGVTLGWLQDVGTFRIQPLLRAQAGRIYPTEQGVRATGVSATLLVSRRF